MRAMSFDSFLPCDMFDEAFIKETKQAEIPCSRNMLVAITYPDDCKIMVHIALHNSHDDDDDVDKMYMSALRMILHKGEISERGLWLVAKMLETNPSHYGLWYVTASVALR